MRFPVKTTSLNMAKEMTAKMHVNFWFRAKS